MKKNIETDILSTKFMKPDAYGSLAMPVYHTAAYEFPNAKAMENAFCGRSPEHAYSRISNPTVQYLERRIQSVTGGISVSALNSGMSAISNALFTVASAGCNIIASSHLFGTTLSLLTNTLGGLGVELRVAHLDDIGQTEALFDENTCALFLEVITNPQMEVADLAALAEISHRHHVPLIADSTIVPFTVFHAKDFGVDIEVLSSTKYISGGATGLGGIIIDYGSFDWSQSHSSALRDRTVHTGRQFAFTARLKQELIPNLGTLMTPQAAYMETLGMETLDIRFRCQSSSALWLARQLKSVDGIVSVNYPGLEDNPFYKISRKQFGELPGAMLTVDLESREACFSFIDHLKLIHRATNLFDHKSLAIHPASTIFGTFTDSQRLTMNVKQSTVRLSIGLEEKEDLLEDIRQSLSESVRQI